MDWLIVLVFITVVILVWLFLSISAKKDKPDIATDIHPGERLQEVSRVDESAAQSVTTNEKIEAEKDVIPTGSRSSVIGSIMEDLTMIEGIGPKFKSVLYENGISSFRDLANAEVSRLREILDKVGYQYMDPSTWGEQAGLLAENRMQEFKELVKSLKGGRRVE